jgi:hypothetical protein
MANEDDPTVAAAVTRRGRGGAEVLVAELPAGVALLPSGPVTGREGRVDAAREHAAAMTGLDEVDLVADRDAPLVHLHVTRRTPDQWWVLVDDDGGHCFRWRWLPVEEAARRLRPDQAASLLAALPAISARPGPARARVPPLLGKAKFWARVELAPFEPRFEITRRRLVPYRHAPSVLTEWRQPAAASFLAAGVAAEDARRWGAAVT